MSFGGQGYVVSGVPLPPEVVLEPADVKVVERLVIILPWLLAQQGIPSPPDLSSGMGHVVPNNPLGTSATASSLDFGRMTNGRSTGPGISFSAALDVNVACEGAGGDENVALHWNHVSYHDKGPSLLAAASGGTVRRVHVSHGLVAAAGLDHPGLLLRLGLTAGGGGGFCRLLEPALPCPP